MAQFIVKDAETQQQVIDIIHRAFPQMQCLKLTINSTSTRPLPKYGFENGSIRHPEPFLEMSI